jgi:hypothetical protein
MRRSAWEAVGGLDESLLIAIDYDLWWRLYNFIRNLRRWNTLMNSSRSIATTLTPRPTPSGSSTTGSHGDRPQTPWTRADEVVACPTLRSLAESRGKRFPALLKRRNPGSV